MSGLAEVIEKSKRPKKKRKRSKPACGGKPPVMLLIHGGGFVQGDPSIPDAEASARATGFQPVEVGYTLGNAMQGLADCKAAAKSFTSKGRCVVAYGESAGAALAARLAQDGDVSGAVALSPPVDLNNLNAPSVIQDMINSMGLTPQQLASLSPADHQTRNPVLVQITTSDFLLSPTQMQSWADADPNVTSQLYVGAHVPKDAERARQLAAAMGYLHDTLPKQKKKRQAGNRKVTRMNTASLKRLVLSGRGKNAGLRGEAAKVLQGRLRKEINRF